MLTWRRKHVEGLMINYIYKSEGYWYGDIEIFPFLSLFPYNV